MGGSKTNQKKAKSKTPGANPAPGAPGQFCLIARPCKFPKKRHTGYKHSISCLERKLGILIATEDSPLTRGPFLFQHPGIFGPPLLDSHVPLLWAPPTDLCASSPAPPRVKNKPPPFINPAN